AEGEEADPRPLLLRHRRPFVGRRWRRRGSELAKAEVRSGARLLRAHALLSAVWRKSERPRLRAKAPGMDRLKFDRGRIPSLLATQWARLNAPFAEGGRE